jgi:deoxyxylulose-5-phosphate synthase
MAKLNLVKALNLALLQEMERDEDVLIMGEDVGVDGGVFRVTEDLHRKFGSKRVIDSPLAEAAIIGAGVGMALYGLKPVCEIQFSGFAFQCFHQIENHVARYRNRSQGRFHVPMVIRMPYGGGVRALEHHSESEEQFYAHIPGLKMVIPSGPRNARALLVSAIRDPDPVVFFEHKGLYHAAKEDVPDEIETMPLGRAQVAREGLGPHADRLRRHAAPGPRGGRHAGRGRRRAVRRHRPADDLPARPRDPHRLGAEDRARGRGARGAAQLRPRRGDRGLDHGRRVPVPGGADRPRDLVGRTVPGLRA